MGISIYPFWLRKIWLVTNLANLQRPEHTLAMPPIKRLREADMGKPANPRLLRDNEAQAFAKTIRVSPQKLNLVAQSIRGLPVERALAELSFSQKRIAGTVKNVLSAAIANAENNHQLDVDRLVVSEATVGKAFVMKRFRARARGRAGKIQKPFSNLTVVVREVEEV